MSTRLDENTVTCQGCMSTNRKMRSMLEICNNNMQSYIDIFDLCFNLKVGQMSIAFGQSCLICSKCVKRLNEAYAFKKSVAETQDKLKMLKIEPFESEITVDIEPFHTTKSTGIVLELNDSVKKENNTVYIKEEHDTRYEFCDNDDIAAVNRKESRQKLKQKTRKLKQSPINSLNKKSTVCSECGLKCSSHRSLVEHLAEHFPNFVCDICGKAYVNKYVMYRHLLTHADDTMKCELCNKVIKVSSLKYHMAQHRGKRPHWLKCDECDQRFSKECFRKAHIKEVHHREMERYPCDLCGNCYSRRGGLKDHKENVHQKKVNFSCDVCNKGFFYKKNLQMHMLKHTGVREHKCEKCQKSFLKKYTLQQHMKIHNNVKNFVCSICNKAFTYKCSLKGHLNSHHPDVQVKI